MRRRTLRLSTLCVAVLGALPVTPAAADGATADGATSVSISGPGLARVLTVHAGDDLRLFTRLLSEVDWLAAGSGTAPTPAGPTLGPSYQLTVLIGDVADQSYQIFPLAVGGPRVFRPAEQPQRSGADAWFYGRVSMPDTLRDAGVPLSGRGADGALGGGLLPARAAPGQFPTVETPPETGIGYVLREWLRAVLLVGLGALGLLFLLGALAALGHRRADRRAARSRTTSMAALPRA